MEKHPNLEVGRAPISLQWRKKLIMVMKCLFFLLLVCHFNVFSEISAQRVARFRMENADLKSCIQQIERLTGIGFLYNGRELEQIKGITLDLQNVEINTILSRLLEGPGYTYEIVNGVVAIKRAVTVNNVDLPQAEKRTVRGVVKDRDGMPLPGVSVLVKGTSSGMATNVDGRFEIKVNDDPNVMLVFSFIGMKSQEMKIGQATTLNVVLEPENKALEEVVVTGYQTISKERATGSFDKVSVEVLNSRPSSDLSNMLQGVVAGMQSTENEDGSVNEVLVENSRLMTYNTAQDVDNAMWMNFNNDSFWSLKFVIPVNYGAKTFSCSDLKCNDADDAPNITVTDGRVLLGKGHNLHGMPADSIVFNAKFSDDKDNLTYRIAGTRHSGFTE